MVRPKTKSKIKQAGFTLVELLVTITIFVMLTGVVIFNQERFNSTIFLTNLSYDIALTLRQAQTYGINIRGFNTGEANAESTFSPYGVNFDLVADKSYILFADIDASDTDDDRLIDSDGIFDGAGGSPSGVSLNACVSQDGCEKRNIIQKGNKISSLCAGTGASSCASADSLGVVFVRPNPEALITMNEDDNVFYNYAEIRVTNAASSSSRTVVIQKNGVVYVKR